MFWRPVIKGFGQLLRLTAQQFYLSLDNPGDSQRQVQKLLCQRLSQTEYGNFLGVKSVVDWPRIPIVTYDQIAPWIWRQKATQQHILTPEPIDFYERTSGSCGPVKLIPYTKSLRRSFSRMFCVWAEDLIRYGPEFTTGKFYFCVSPKLVANNSHDPSQDCSQETIGLADDSEYLDGWLRWCLRPFWLLPPGLSQVQTAEEFKECLALALLAAPDLEIISIWSPSFLKVNLDYIQAHSLRLLEKLQDRISHQRSHLLRQLLLESAIPWTEVWPKLKLISCWDQSHSASQAAYLQSLFSGVMIQGKGLLATEAPMTIPLIPAQGFVPVLNEVFFEFEDPTGRVYSLAEIQVGEVYEIIISQLGGLYRYRIGDRVQVTHFYRQTPCLEFVGRQKNTSDLVGEKLQEDFVREILASLPLTTTFFQSLWPVLCPHPYYLLLLDRAEQPVKQIAQEVDGALMRSHHYRQARLLGQLAPVRVLVSQQFPEIMVLFKTRQGKKWGDLKHELLAIAPIDPELLGQLEQVAAADSKIL